MIKIFGLAVVVVLLGFGFIVAGLYLQVPRYKHYWLKRAAKAPESNALIYVAMGDSTAQGIGASNTEKGYVGLVADALEQKHRRPVHVINISKSGETVAGCLQEQVPQLRALKPDIVTIEIGANDMSTFDETTFRRSMGELMSQVPKQTVISDIPYLGGSRKKDLEPHAEAASSIIHELAATHGLSVAPLHQVTKAKDSWRVYAVDYFHPSNTGYKNWFAAFWQILDS